MSYRPRIPIKFTNRLNTETFTFPTADFEYEIEQELHVGHAPLTGAHGALDLLGDGVAVKAPMVVRIAFVVLEDSPEAVELVYDEMLDKCWRFGLGKLWTSGREGDPVAETLRWTRARLLSMPRQSWQAGEILTKGASVSFICPQAQWFDDDALNPASHAIAASPTTVTVTNPGNDRIYNAVLTLAGTYANPVIENLTNGYTLESTRDGSSANHILRFDAGKPAVEFSSDGGTNYSGDYPNFVRQRAQAHWMVLEPGDNSIKVTGCSSGTLGVTAYGAYH